MKSIVGHLLSTLNKSPVSHGAGETLLAFDPSSSSSDRKRNLGTMGAQSTIFAIVDRIATDVAAATWSLFRKARSGKPEDREQVKVHPALTVWNKPNPFNTQVEFVEAMMQHYELAGEWWWILARSEMLNGAGPPVELWTIRPDKMTPIPDPKRFISGFVYTNGSEDVKLSVDDVIYNKRPNPMDPYRGISPVGTLLIDIAGEAAAAKFNTNFFRSGAEPGGMLKLKEELDDDEFTRLLERWRQTHQGVRNAHRVGVLEGGAEWIPNQYTQRDMQFEQLRRFSRQTFREAWGFPKALLGDVEDVNRANAEAAEYVFAKHLLEPRLRRLRTTLNDDFLPHFGVMGDGYEFDFATVTPPNPAEERATKSSNAASAASLVVQGFDPAETLEAFDLPPIKFIGKPGAAKTPELQES